MGLLGLLQNHRQKQRRLELQASELDNNPYSKEFISSSSAAPPLASNATSFAQHPTLLQPPLGFEAHHSQRSSTSVPASASNPYVFPPPASETFTTYAAMLPHSDTPCFKPHPLQNLSSPSHSQPIPDQNASYAPSQTHLPGTSHMFHLHSQSFRPSFHPTMHLEFPSNPPPSWPPVSCPTTEQGYEPSFDPQREYNARPSPYDRSVLSPPDRLEIRPPSPSLFLPPSVRPQPRPSASFSQAFSSRGSSGSIVGTAGEGARETEDVQMVDEAGGSGGGIVSVSDGGSRRPSLPSDLILGRRSRRGSISQSSSRRSSFASSMLPGGLAISSNRPSFASSSSYRSSTSSQGGPSFPLSPLLYPTAFSPSIISPSTPCFASHQSLHSPTESAASLPSFTDFLLSTSNPSGPWTPSTSVRGGDTRFAALPTSPRGSLKHRESFERGARADGKEKRTKENTAPYVREGGEKGLAHQRSTIGSVMSRLSADSGSGNGASSSSLILPPPVPSSSSGSSTAILPSRSTVPNSPVSSFFPAHAYPPYAQRPSSISASTTSSSFSTDSSLSQRSRKSEPPFFLPPIQQHDQPRLHLPSPVVPDPPLSSSASSQPALNPFPLPSRYTASPRSSSPEKILPSLPPILPRPESQDPLIGDSGQQLPPILDAGDRMATDLGRFSIGSGRRGGG
jgi:hypothetical protein